MSNANTDGFWETVGIIVDEMVREATADDTAERLAADVLRFHGSMGYNSGVWGREIAPTITLMISVELDAKREQEELDRENAATLADEQATDAVSPW